MDFHSPGWEQGTFEKFQMKPATRLKRFLLFLAVAAWLPPVGAIEITFTAEIDGYGRTQGATIEAAAEALMPIGSLVAGRITYDPAADVLDRFGYQNGEAVTYRGSGFSIAVGAISANARTQDLTVGNGGAGGVDQLVNWADVDNGMSSSGTPFPVYRMSLGLYDAPGTIFESTALPGTPLSMDDFNQNIFDMIFVRDLQNTADLALANGHVTSLAFNGLAPIPAPSTAALLGLGLLLVASGCGMRGRISSKRPRLYLCLPIE